MIRLALILMSVALLAVSSAFAQNKPAARDAATIRDCIKTKTGRNWNWEHCIGIISEVCAKDESSMTPSQVIDCYDRERIGHELALRGRAKEAAPPRAECVDPLVQRGAPAPGAGLSEPARKTSRTSR